MAFRRSEKLLMLTSVGTFALMCVLSLFYLPDRSSFANDGSSNRVYRVYKGLQDTGKELILPLPPLSAAESSHRPAAHGHDVGREGDNPQLQSPDINFRHGELEDKHKLDDARKILAQAELDEQIRKLQQQQQQKVLPKPAIQSRDVKKNVSKSTPVAAKSKGGAAAVAVAADLTASQKRDKVKEMMLHAWSNYEKYAWGANELKPLSKKGHSASVFGSSPMGATIVDGLDTLYIMGLQEEFKRGRDWVEQNLDFSKVSGDISVFETNIRFVGGMLTLYALTGDEMFKDKAVHIVDHLLPAFKTRTGIPNALVNFRTGSSMNFAWASGGSSILSEFGTLHMEFAYLSDITGNPVYRDAVNKIRRVVKGAKRSSSLYPNYLNPRTGEWGSAHTSVGALGDSFYEYLLKEWLRSGKKDAEAKEMFDNAALGIEDRLAQKTGSGLLYFAEYKYGRLEHKMDHLACFTGGMFALAAHEEKDDNSDRWMEIGKGITNTCHESYARSNTKLGPEAIRFSNGNDGRALRMNEKHYILRPETVESYFVMWRLTHDQKYRDWGWQAVQALDKHCRTEGGFSGIRNVYSDKPALDDVQQSYFLAETLKYLYLLFCDDDVIPLDQWVFNTEAHPLPVKGANSKYRQAPKKPTDGKPTDALKNQ